MEKRKKKDRLEYKRRKYRKYFLEEILGVDSYSGRAFYALKSKLVRDYLGFFRSIEKLYPTGELREEARAASSLTISTVRLIDESIRSGAPKKEVIDDIIANIDVLNAQKDFFVKQSESSLLLQNRMKRVEEETDISPESLNITEEMVRQVAGVERRERRKVRGGRFPRTRELGAELGLGVARAALGPFYEVARTALTPLRELFTFGRERFRERRERKLGELLRPTAMEAPIEELERGTRLRSLGLSVPRVRGVSERLALSESFVDFFNKGAYEAKWTKELLQRIKEIGRPREKGEGLLGMLGLDDLINKFGLLGAGILSLIGKAGLLAALGIAIEWTISKYYELGKALVDYNEAMKKVQKVYSEAADTLKAREEMIKEVGIGKVAIAAGTTPREISMRQVSMEQRREYAARMSGTWWETFKRRYTSKYTPKYTTKWGFWPSEIKRPEELSFYEKTQEMLRRLGGIPQVYTTPEIQPTFPKGTEPIRKAIERTAEGEAARRSVEEDVANAIKLLTEEIRRGKSAPLIKEPGLGDPFDSADSLLREYSGGTLTLEAR